MGKKATVSGLQAPGGTPLGGAPPIASWLRLREDSAMPIYQQLEEQLTLSIQEGKLKAGATLPMLFVLIGVATLCVALAIWRTMPKV